MIAHCCGRRGQNQNQNRDRTMQCEFCKSGVDVTEGERWTICRLCKQVSKKCKKGSGQYYRIADGAADAGTYLSGDELADAGAAVGRKALVFDYHNVVDRFTPEEFAELTKPFVASHALFVLSYVGSTTWTRVEADADIRARMVLVPGLQGYLCFRRSKTVEPGNKGGFIRALGAANVWFFDDSPDHVESGKAAGADCLLVSKEDGCEARRMIGLKLRELLGLSVPDADSGGSGRGGGSWGKGGGRAGRGGGRGRVQGGWAA